MPDGLDSGYHLPEYDDASWFNAEIPADVRDIMFKNRVIPDPYFGRNSDATAWVVDYEWWYRRRFEIPLDYRNKRIRLIFKGVDLIAEYYFWGYPLDSRRPHM